MWVYFHPVFLAHLKGVSHPENPQRLRAVMDGLKQCPFREAIHFVEPSPAERQWVERNHSPQYLDRLRQACHQAPAVVDSGDTVVTEHSWEAALRAAGAGLEAVDAVMRGKTQTVFCAVRPPGHHAEYDQAAGFCLINNVAVAAHYAIEKWQLARVFILDWDVHHGNGTQHSFYNRSDVFYCSLHQWPLYPGTGRREERGSGKGEGYTLNIPFPPGTGDRVYFQALEEQVLPALEQFRPQLCFLSAGFDAHKDDPLAGLELSTQAFYEMTVKVVDRCRKVGCQGIVSFLEGGYHHHNLSRSVEVHIKGLMHFEE